MWFRRSAERRVDAPKRPQPFRIQQRWKEDVSYWEGDRGCHFDAAWGVTPHLLYIPDRTIWDHVVPDWLVGRYDVVYERLVAESGDTVIPTTEGYGGKLHTLSPSDCA